MFLKNAWLFVLEATGDISCKPDRCSSHDAAGMLDGAAPPSEAPVPESMTTVRIPHPFFLKKIIIFSYISGRTNNEAQYPEIYFVD